MEHVNPGGLEQRRTHCDHAAGHSLSAARICSLVRIHTSLGEWFFVEPIYGIRRIRRSTPADSGFMTIHDLVAAQV